MNSKAEYSAKLRHGSPEWTILSHIYCVKLIQRARLGYKSLTWTRKLQYSALSSTRSQKKIKKEESKTNKRQCPPLIRFSKGKLLRSSWHHVLSGIRAKCLLDNRSILAMPFQDWVIFETQCSFCSFSCSKGYKKINR